MSSGRESPGTGTSSATHAPSSSSLLQMHRTDTLRSVEPWTDEDERAELAALVQVEFAEIRADLSGQRHAQMPALAGEGLPGEDVEGSMKSIGQAILRDPSSALSAAILARLDQEVFNLLSTTTAAAAAAAASTGGLQQGGASASSQIVAQAAAAAYLGAARRCPEQANDVRRRVACLVHSNGSATNAARMIVQYWHHRVELFGPEEAYLPMTLGGALRNEVMDLSNRHIWHILPLPDAAGRAVLYCRPANRNLGQYGVDRELRTLWYLLETIAEDDVTAANANPLDRRGVVFLYDVTGLEWEQTSQRLDRYLEILSGVFPVPFRAFHVCCLQSSGDAGEASVGADPASDKISSIARAMQRLVPKHIRRRFKVHRGSALQVLQSLAAFALPADRMPSDLGGNLVVNMGNWMVNRISVENVRTQQQLEPALAAFHNFLAPPIPPPPAVLGDPGLTQLLLSGSAFPSSAAGPVVQPSLRPTLTDTILQQMASRQAAGAASSLASLYGSPVATVRNVAAGSTGLQGQGTATARANSTDGGFSSARSASSGKRAAPQRGRGIRNPKMDRAVKLKLANPDMSHFDVLVEAGFVFRARAGDGTGGMICEGEVKTHFVHLHYWKRMNYVIISACMHSCTHLPVLPPCNYNFKHTKTAYHCNSIEIICAAVSEI